METLGDGNAEPFHKHLMWTHSPYINHFIQPDTIIPSLANPQTWNRYSYVQNNPIRFNDPTGHKCAPDDGCSGSQYTKADRIANWKWRIKDKFGIKMVDYDKNKSWTIKGLSLVYDSLQNIDNVLNGKLKSLVDGASFWLKKQNASDGQYHGVTHLDGSGIDFYTLNNDTLRQMNIYHEVGHLLDNVPGLKNVFTNEVAGQVFRDDAGNYLFGGRGVGEISDSTLRSATVYDPNYGPPDSLAPQAIQHASTDPSEQWADMFANYVAGNIQAEGEGGGMMITAVQLYLIRHLP